MSTRPTLVVGGGPSGAVTALLLARAGRPVVVIDRHRFPRAKACGECANPGTIRHLEELGLADDVRAIGTGRLHGWSVRDTGGREFRVPFPAGVRTWTVDRRAFDQTLLEAAARAGADIREGVAFDGIDELRADGGRARIRRVGRSGTSSVAFEHLVGADGLHSRVRAALGLGRRGPRRKVGVSLHVGGVELDPRWGCLRPGGEPTIGLSPLDPRGSRWTLVLVWRDAPHAALEPSRVISEAARHIPALRSAVPASDVRGSGPYDRPVDRPWHRAAVLVGDAAGYLDPVTGQGIGRAVSSARLAAAALLKGGGRADLAAYARAVEADRRAGLRVQRLIDGVARRPALFDRVLPVLQRSGALADLVAVTGDHLPPRELVSPSRWVGWIRAGAASLI